MPGCIARPAGPRWDMLAEEAAHLHVLPTEAHTSALGETRVVGDDQTVRFGSMRYSTPDGHQGSEVWCRVVGEELAIVGRGAKGLSEIARHRLSTPGNPQILDEHYPRHPGGNGPRPPRIAPPQRSRGPGSRISGLETNAIGGREAVGWWS